MKSFLNRFLQDETGVTSLEFVIIFPVFFGMFLMTYESGMVSARHVMLERGVDIAVRQVRIGAMPNPTRASLRKSICEVALIIPQCERQLEIELLQRDPMNWVAVPNQIRCVDRGDIDRDPGTIDVTGNNMLMVLRACVRIDPFLPTSGLGKVIVDRNSGGAADGSYALVATAAFVVEPFRADVADDDDADGDADGS